MVRRTSILLLAAGALLAAGGALPAWAGALELAGAPAAGFGIGAGRVPLAPAGRSASWAGPLALLERGEPEGRAFRSPSRLKALGASLLLPGLGQRALGRPVRARVFLMVEAALLAGILVNEAQGYVRREGYIEYAEDFGGVAEAGGQPDWYYRNLGSYASSEDYVADIARTARALYGNDLAAREDYIARNRPTPEQSWQWGSDAERLEYRERRKESRNAFRRASLFIGALVFNHVLSAVDAARLAGSPRGGGLQVRADETGAPYLCLAWSLP